MAGAELERFIAVTAAAIVDQWPDTTLADARAAVERHLLRLYQLGPSARIGLWDAPPRPAVIDLNLPAPRRAR